MVIEYANHLVERGHEVTIMAQEDETVFSVSGLIHRVKVKWPGKLGFLAYSILKKLPFDILVIDIIHLTPLLRCGENIVYFAQADDVEYYHQNLQRRFIHLLYQRYFHGHGRCITVSKHLTQAFFDRYGADKCKTVGNGIDLKTFFPQQDSELVRSKGARKAVFFMARGDHFRKGYDLALQLFHQLPAQIADAIQLWVCGETLKEDCPFPVKNFGVVDDQRLRMILSSADIFFYPSRHEGFGLFPLEAMACGCVVVTTRAVPYVKDFPCIYTSEIGSVDQLIESFKDVVLKPVELDKRRSEGYRVAKLFNIEKSKVAFEEALVSFF